MTDADLSAIERAIEGGDLTHGHVRQLIAEVRRLQATLDGDPHQTATPDQRRAWRLSAIRYADKVEAERDAMLELLDAIIAGYEAEGIGPLLLAIRAAQKWRQAKTSQDVPGATQST